MFHHFHSGGGFGIVVLVIGLLIVVAIISNLKTPS